MPRMAMGTLLGLDVGIELLERIWILVLIFSSLEIGFSRNKGEEFNRVGIFL